MLTDRSHRRLWRRVRTLSEGLELPDPFDAETFLALLAERRGRPIEVLPVAVDAGVPCGLLVTTDHADYILCTPGTSALHRQHILVHEAAHLLCGHDRRPAPEAPGVRALLPGLSPTWCAGSWAAPCTPSPPSRRQNCSPLSSCTAC